MNEIIKNEATIALDEVARSASELLRVEAALLDHLADPAGGHPRALDRTALAAALERFIAARQEEGELPVAGDLERDQWKSLGLRLKALLEKGPDSAALARETLAECEALEAQIAAARGFDLSPGIAQALQALEAQVAEQTATLRALAGISAAQT